MRLSKACATSRSVWPGRTPAWTTSANASSAIAQAALMAAISSSSLTARRSSTGRPMPTSSTPGGCHQQRMVGHGYVVVLETQPATARLNDAPSERANDVTIDEKVDVGYFRTGLRAVTTIGGEHAGVRRYEERGIRTGEAGEIADVHETRDEQRVDLQLGGLVEQQPQPRLVRFSHEQRQRGSRAGRSPGRSRQPSRWRPLR